MRKLTVNLPDAVVSEVSGMDQSKMVALGQAVSMYPWLGELLHCVGLEAQRQRWLDQQYDLGEPKSDVRKKWDALDRKRCDAYDAGHVFDKDGVSIGLRGTSAGIGTAGISLEDDELGRAWHPGWDGLSPAEKVECLGRMQSD